MKPHGHNIYFITDITHLGYNNDKTENLNYADVIHIIEVRVSPHKEAKRKKMNSEEEINRGVPLDRTEEVPGCCGEQMQPILRYMEEGIIRRLFQCNFCGGKVSV